MAEDVIAGRSTEITQLNLQIAQRAAELDLPAPTHNTIVELIRAIDAPPGRAGVATSAIVAARHMA